MPNTAPAASEAMPIDRKLITALHPDQMPETYCMQAMGSCMEPVYPDGSKLLFSSTERYRYGDDVAIWFRPELVMPGEHQIIIKRIVVTPRREFWTGDKTPMGNIAPTVIVEMLNPRRMLQFDPSAIMGIHKCLGPVPANIKTHKVSDDWVRQQAKARTLEEAF